MLADYHVHRMLSDDLWYVSGNVVADIQWLNLDEVCFLDRMNYSI